MNVFIKTVFIIGLLNCHAFANEFKVIALAPNIVEMIFSIGAGDKIIATTEYADFPERAKLIPRIGNYANLQIEKIIALQPDYIFSWKDGNSPADLKRLESLGFKLVDISPKSIFEVKENFEVLGKTLKINTDEITNKYMAKLKKLEQEYSIKTPVKVFYEIWGNPLTTISGSSFIQQSLNLCGAENVFANLKTDYPIVSIESVLMAAPSIIIQPKDKFKNNFKDWAEWQNIPAVSNKAFIQPNADKLHRLTLRTLDEINILCQKIDAYR